MPRTFLRQDTQIRRSDVYDDTIAPAEAAFETDPVTIEDDLNNLRSMSSELRDGRAGDWWNALTAPLSFESGAIRGVQNVNQDLHDLERKRWLRPIKLLVDITVGGSDNFVILGSGELPTNTTAAVGAVTTRGTVVAAHGGTFGTHALSEVGGAHALSPKNLLEISDASGDPILSSGRRIWGLLQGESGLTDGTTITTTTTTRIQISFVRSNAAHTDLEACPAVDVQGQDIRYCYVERIANIDMTEQDWLARGAAIDIGAGAASVTRQVAYDNQGTTPVDQVTNAVLDLEGAGLAWRIRDDLEATLFEIVEGSAGGTSIVRVATDVDTFDVNAVVNDFNAGATIGSGGANPIEVGVTTGLIRTTANVLTVQSADDLILNDANLVAEGTWAGPGVKLSDTTAEVAAYETAFGGELSLMAAITAAASAGGRGTKTYANCTSNEAADVDIGGTGGGSNLDAQLPDLSSGSFLLDYDVFWNGQLIRPGANAAANNDYYPGTSLALGQIKLEFKAKSGDVVAVIPWS